MNLVSLCDTVHAIIEFLLECLVSENQLDFSV